LKRSAPYASRPVSLLIVFFFFFVIQRQLFWQRFSTQPGFVRALILDELLLSLERETLALLKTFPSPQFLFIFPLVKDLRGTPCLPSSFFLLFPLDPIFPPSVLSCPRTLEGFPPYYMLIYCLCFLLFFQTYFIADFETLLEYPDLLLYCFSPSPPNVVSFYVFTPLL